MDAMQAAQSDNVQEPTQANVEQSAEVKQEPTQDNDTVKRLALLAKKERQLLEREQKMRSEYESKLKDLEERFNPAKGDFELAQAVKNKDWSKLKDVFDYNDYTKFLLNDGQTTPETLIEKRMAELEAKFESKLKEKEVEIERKQTENAKQATEAQLTAFKRQIKDELGADFNSEDPKFQWLSTQESPEELVYEVINAHYEKTQKEEGRGRVLKTDEAAEMVEKYLETEAEKRLAKVKKLKTLNEKLFAPKEPLGEKGKDTLAQAVNNAKTLTNSASAPVSTSQKLSGSAHLSASLENATKLLRFK